MNDMVEKTIVRDKIKVFISSRCGVTKYDDVRKKLKDLIEQTGLARVYLFEDGLASTQTAEQNYLYALDDSDVCIFLIDNADGVTPAIVNEINRAKSQSKKSIYLFCNEREKEPTQIQNELIGAKGSRFYIASSFSEFITIGYESLINDIGEIYRLYCKNRLRDQEFSDYSETKIEIASQSYESIKKDVLKGLDKTKAFITRQIYDTKRKIKDTSKLDDYCEAFLHVLFGLRSIREFNTSLLLDYLEKAQSEILFKIVKIRWKAIQSYWQGDLSSCLSYLEDALIKAKESSLPDWLIQDILIDLRNTSNRYGEEKNQYFIQSDAQEELDKMEKALYYPLLDRYTNNLYEEIDKQRIKYKTQSPYSVSFGNHIDIFADKIANSFVIAVFNGSLIHIILTLDRIKSVAFHLSEKYSNWQFRVLLLKMGIYKGNKKEIDSYINTFNDVFGKMNSSDALEIYNFSKSNSIKHLRSISVLEAFKHLGYYFSDKDYEEIKLEVLQIIDIWLKDKERLVVVGNHIFDALKNNNLRLDNNIIAQICLDVISQGLYRYYDNVFNLLSFIGLEEVNNELSTKLISEINKIVIDEAEYDKYHNLISAIISIRKTKGELSDDFHENVMKHLPEKDKSTYTLEVTGKSRDENRKQLLKYIAEINERNKTQGQNGQYSGYANDPYQTASNIIRYGNVDLSKELVQSIFEAATGTLLSNKQLISDKVSAMQLIVFVKAYCGSKMSVTYDFYAKLVDEIEVVKNGHDGFLERYSTTTLNVNFLMLEVVFNDADYRSFFEVLSGYNKLDDFEKIEALKAIVNLLENEYCKSINRDILFMLLQFVLTLCNEENHDIRYYSAKALLLLITEDTEKTILTQLSQFMDFDSSFIKHLIMDHFDQLIEVNPDITKFMIQKASVDNHFVIREKGKEYLEKLLG
ncbi:DUF4062 domain-containing protein [Lederbergia sp. NSJ-179]|uniref:DUF4062 domain-containing protein n=1 Tax=Lederbergia sp. NSJ-179 TaxID=2931402 RepID=UPI001FD068A2|nr:DUF4062 domain-containing protein [Lederbergia sp. NSJ-179]MCJ7840681.1 DUF4062 domain-containing protein [Lederbergia sp. NSJ-179]